MTIQASLETIAKHRCSAILRTPLRDAAAPAMQAAVEGGFRIVEFTLTTPDAIEHIAAFAADDRLLVGAGTVLSTDEAAAATEAGARFLVSPVTDPEVIGWCKARDVLAIPGAYTPTEMLSAHRAGAEVVKLFPSPGNAADEGPSYLRACLGPLPFLRLFPTSGVTEANVQGFLAAGAFGVGFVNNLFEAADLAAGDFTAVRERAARMVGLVGASNS